MIDQAIERGADNVAVRCLAVRQGEEILLLQWRAAEVADAIGAAVVRAGGTIRRVDLEPHVQPGDTSRSPALHRVVSGMFGDASASVAVVATGFPVSASATVVEVARAAKARHLHVTRTELRLLGQSMRADPSLIETINQRVAAMIQPPATVRVTSAAGTDLTIELSSEYRIQTNHGRPSPGEFENLPAGEVYTHPARVDGTFVADRGIFGSLVESAGFFTRRAPVRFTLEAGAVVGHETTDTRASGAIDAYLTSHVNARRVGLVSFPTNYLVRSEIGSDVQDGLMPGMKLCLGIAAPALTGARFDATVQLRAFGRQLTVEVSGERLVVAGRLAETLVRGFDPFR